MVLSATAPDCPSARVTSSRHFMVTLS